jgi:hypothetical protein
MVYETEIKPLISKKWILLVGGVGNKIVILL